MIKDTLYAKYISQRAGHEILENEHGFVIYKINGESVLLWICLWILIREKNITDLNL